MKRGTPGHWKIQNLALDLKIEPYAAVALVAAPLLATSFFFGTHDASSICFSS